MTLSADEKTIHDGQPIELYEFTLTGGTSAAYYYTDYDQNLSVLGNTYTAIPIRRSAIAAADIDEDGAVTIEVSFALSLLTEIAYKIPPRGIDLKIRRYHGDILDESPIWEGRVVSTRVKGRIAQITAISYWAHQLQSQLPAAPCSTTCRYILYGPLCDPGGTLRASRTTSTTISTIDSDDPRIITVGSLSGPAGEDTYKNGEVIRTSDGERRMITARSGTQLTLVRPFRTLAVGNGVDVAEGCTHVVSYCDSRHSNSDNFGGEPYINPIDLWRRGIFGGGPRMN